MKKEISAREQEVSELLDDCYMYKIEYSKLEKQVQNGTAPTKANKTSKDHASGTDKDTNSPQYTQTETQLISNV